MTTDPFDDFVDAGTKATMAALAGDEEEYKRQVQRGREARLKMIIRKGIEDVSNELQRVCDEPPRRRKRKRPGPKVTTNLGDLLKDAGITPADEEETE